jgi:outer membrane immunogenic protein
MGWGAEWALTPRWSVKGEYLFFDFGKVRTFGVSSAGDPYRQSISVKVHTAKIGVNYRW